MALLTQRLCAGVQALASFCLAMAGIADENTVSIRLTGCLALWAKVTHKNSG